MDIGSNIRKIRELKGYSQEYVSNQLGISQRQFSRLENNQCGVGISKLKEISTILEVTPVQLLGFNEKVIFQDSTNLEVGIHSNAHFIDISEKERKLYEKQITQLQEELVFLKRQFEMLLRKT